MSTAHIIDTHFTGNGIQSKIKISETGVRFWDSFFRTVSPKSNPDSRTGEFAASSTFVRFKIVSAGGEVLNAVDCVFRLVRPVEVDKDSSLDDQCLIKRYLF